MRAAVARAWAALSTSPKPAPAPTGPGSMPSPARLAITAEEYDQHVAAHKAGTSAGHHARTYCAAVYVYECRDDDTRMGHQVYSHPAHGLPSVWCEWDKGTQGMANRAYFVAFVPKA